MSGKIAPISSNVGKGEQLSTWPDGNRMNEPDLNEGQEMKQGGAESSQKGWELLADGLGQDVKATSLQDCVLGTLVPGTYCKLNPPSFLLHHRWYSLAISLLQTNCFPFLSSFPFSFFPFQSFPSFFPRGCCCPDFDESWSYPVTRHLSRTMVCVPLWVITSCLVSFCCCWFCFVFESWF